MPENAEIYKSPSAEGMSNSRNIDTAAMYSTLQPISTEINPGDDVTPSADSVSEQPQPAGGQAYPSAMNVPAAEQSESPVPL